MRVSRAVAGLVVGLTLSATLASAPAFADSEPTQDEVVALVLSSDDPLVTLDQLPQSQGDLFVQALKEEPTITDGYESEFDLDTAGDEPAPTPVFSASRYRIAAVSRYNDVSWKIIESVSCVVDIADVPTCAAAKNDADVAAQFAEDTYPSLPLHNDKGDALRHCYWNARMVFSAGRGVAAKIASNHEQTWNAVAAEKTMDLHNNLAGRVIGDDASSRTSARSACLSEANRAKKSGTTLLVLK